MENNNENITTADMEKTAAGNSENIEKLLKKQLFAARVTMVCAIGLVCCFIVITLAIVNTVAKVDAVVAAVETMSAEVKNVVASTTELEAELTKTISEFNEVLPTLGEASEAIAEISESLNDEGLPKLYETLDQLEGLEKLQNIDIESLNGAITSLYNVVAPLSRLFGTK